LNLPYVAPLAEGFLLCLGIIFALGPKNSFVLHQGLRREFLLTVVLLASLTDLMLITLGVVGVGSVLTRQPVTLQVITWAGATFLVAYGWRSFRCALSPLSQTVSQTSYEPLTSSKRSAVIFTVLAVSLLNPAAYLDTLLIIGGGAVRYEPSLKLYYASGAILASIVWFFALAFAAARFAEVLSNKSVLRLIDGLTGVMMWFIATRLLLHAF
jgi:L-lysine exporter family protein LysE/ArgO